MLDALEADTPAAFELRPETFDCLHYPGYTFAQFLAAMGPRAGVFVAARDATGRPKQVKPLATDDGRIRLALAHLGDPATVDTEVVVGGFTGDWEDAALLYREWALTQPWAARPLAVREDVPAWLLDSPMPVVIRAAGVVDDGPADPNPAFVPYERALPALDALAEATGGPLMPILMAWEREGPWVYPESLPPIGGAASFAAFTAAARERGWHAGTFCDGTRWVVGHRFSGYDGRDHFVAAGGPGRASPGPRAASRGRRTGTRSGARAIPACLAVDRTREIARDYVATLAGELGLDMIQFFDQNLGGTTFPCYAEDHPHPSVPGPWMTSEMTAFMGEVHDTAVAAAATSRAGGTTPGPAPTIAISVESAPAEVHLGSIQLCDIRAVVDGHRATDPLWDGAVPLFHFLYHELLPIQGGFGWAPEPHHVALRNAWNLVIGELPGGVLTPSGRLLDRDTVNWAPWDAPVEDADAGLAVLRHGLALRRGAGRDHLVFGRMERTARVRGIPIRALDARGPASRDPGRRPPDVARPRWPSGPRRRELDRKDRPVHRRGPALRRGLHVDRRRASASPGPAIRPGPTASSVAGIRVAGCSSWTGPSGLDVHPGRRRPRGSQGLRTAGPPRRRSRRRPAAPCADPSDCPATPR